MSRRPWARAMRGGSCRHLLRIREDGADKGQSVAGFVVDVAAAATEDGGHLLRCEPDLECGGRGQVVGDTEGIGHAATSHSASWSTSAARSSATRDLASASWPSNFGA